MMHEVSLIKWSHFSRTLPRVGTLTNTTSLTKSYAYSRQILYLDFHRLFKENIKGEKGKKKKKREVKPSRLETLLSFNPNSKHYEVYNPNIHQILICIVKQHLDFEIG